MSTRSRKPHHVLVHMVTVGGPAPSARAIFPCHRASGLSETDASFRSSRPDLENEIFLLLYVFLCGSSLSSPLIY